MTHGETIESIDALSDRLQAWLRARIPSGARLTVEDAAEPKQGFSSRAVLFRARWPADGTICTRDLVARIQRESDCPMLADVFHQYRVLEVARSLASEYPACLWPRPIPRRLASLSS